jgi:quinoprotein glucose dehydrogenase
VKTLLLPLVGIVLAVAASCPLTHAADKPAASAPEATRKPAPSWVKIIDQGDLDPRLKGYKTPEGVKVEIVAENPVVINPTGMTFGDDGTPYVLVRDAIKTLSDAKGKGVYDSSKVVLETKEATGLLLHDRWLYVAEGDNAVRRYKQSTGAGDYDVKEVVAKGLGGFARHMSSPAMIIGLDGWLYLVPGQGDNVIEGSDGSRATVLRSGAVFRCRTDGSKMETFAIGFIGSYGNAAFDAVGNLFAADTGTKDAGEFADGRLEQVFEGSDYGWRMRSDVSTAADPMRAGGPGALSPMLKFGRSAMGLFVYTDTRFPENYRGLLIQPSALIRPDALRRVIHAYIVRPRGATFEVAEEFDLLKSDDPLFQPRQAVAGPDGAIYVVDRHSNLILGKPRGDGEHGRIYRLTWTGTKDQPALPPRDRDSAAKVAKLDDDDLIKALIANESGDAPRLELIRRGEKERPALLKLLKDGEQPDEARIAALSALESMWNGDVQALAVHLLTKESSADLRRLSADALGLNAAKGDDDVHSGLLRALTDAAPEVRRSAALAMSHVAAPGAADVLVNTWAFDDGRDPVLSDGLVRAIENLGRLGVSRLVALGESGVQKETDKAVQAFTMFRTRAGADAIPRLLENPHLNAVQRIALLRSYNNYLLDPPVSLAPALEYLTTHKDAAVLKGAILALGGDAEGARFLGHAFLDKKLPAEALPDVTEVLRRQADKDPECAKLLTAVMKEKAEPK